jgi:hypothetical protein
MVQRRINPTTVPFGFRKLDAPVIMDFFKNLSEKQEQQKNIHAETDFNNYLYSILGSLKPVRPIRGKNYAYGPFVFTERNPANTDEYQKQVSEKLAFKLRDNLRSKYLGYG